MRALVASTGMTSHFAPLLPVLHALRRRGDEPLVLVPVALEETVKTIGCRYRLADSPPQSADDEIWRRFAGASREERSLLANRELFGRLWTAAMLPAAERVCEEWAPELVVHEPTAYAPAIAAHRRGIPHVEVAISLAEVEAASLELAAPALEPYSDRIVEALRASTYLTRFPGSMDPSPYPSTVRFREPYESERTALPGGWPDNTAPLIYATFGTVAPSLPVGQAALRMTLEATENLPVRLLLTVGRHTDVSALGPIPGNAHVEPWIPQAAVLAEASLVVCHGGSGTTFGALAAGLPLVMVPMFADQLTNAGVVSASGAGVTVELGRGKTATVDGIVPGDARRLRAAIEVVLGGSKQRLAARRIGREMSRLPVIDEALDRLVATLGAV